MTDAGSGTGPSLGDETGSLPNHFDRDPAHRRSNSSANGAENSKREEAEDPHAGEKETTRCRFWMKDGQFTVVDALLIVGGMIMYIADLVLDLVLAAQYFRKDRKLWSAMTFLFVLLPSVVLQYFSFRWFMHDMQRPGSYGHPSGQTPRMRRIVSWCEWLLSHILQLGTIKRYWRHLKFSYRSPSDEASRELMVQEYRDITMLRVLEAFLEAAPQLVLQMYIMLETEEVYWLTACSAATSLVSVSWALGAYHKALRDARLDRKQITYLSVALRVMWRLFTIAARVLAMAFFAAVFEWWIFVVTGIHWVFMTLWLIIQKTDFCDSNRCEEVLFDGVIGVIHIFCFFNMKEGRTRYRASLFYSVVFIENTVMIALWYSRQESREQVYGLPVLIVVWGCFFIGIFFMMFYYRFYHPNGKLPLCVRIWEEPEIDEPQVHEATGIGDSGDMAVDSADKAALSADEDIAVDSITLQDGGPKEYSADRQGGMELLRSGTTPIQENRDETKALSDEEYSYGKMNLFSYRSRRFVQPHLK